jgi:hypothetical protein
VQQLWHPENRNNLMYHKTVSEEVEIDLRLIQLKKTQLLLLQKLFKTINLLEPKKATASIANRSSRGAGDYPDYKAAPTRVDGTLIKGRSNAQRITPFSPAQGNRAKTTEEMLRNSDTRGYKSGGRAGYKHGGSTGSSKSSGAAKRGISPILMKGRK